MTRRFQVYGLHVEEALQYIGATNDLAARRHHHRHNRLCGGKFTIKVLRTCQTEHEAKEIEAQLIRELRPPMNIQHSQKRPSRTINTYRVNTNGARVPVRFLLREGVMHPDEARSLWEEADDKADRAIVRRMPGWTVERAQLMFGKRR